MTEPYVPDPQALEIAEQAYCSVAVLRPRSDEIAAAVLTALHAAGRLLPTGGEERTEWAYAEIWFANDGPQLVRQVCCHGEANPRHNHSFQHTITEWPDGRMSVGPWAPVNEGSGT